MLRRRTRAISPSSRNWKPLTTRDWVNSPQGSAYGVLRSSNQLLEASILNRTSVKGLFIAGQSVMAPGILGTILGSLGTVKLIIGPERYDKMFKHLRLEKRDTGRHEEILI